MNNEPIVLILVTAVCIVFVGSFVATLFIPNYQGAAVFAPVMTSLGGLVLGLAMSKRKGDGNGGAK